MELAIPTRVGVNLSRLARNPGSGGDPHARGGEPRNPSSTSIVLAAIPTRVGVNR